MTRNASSAKKGSTGANRTVMLLLAEFTALPAQYDGLGMVMLGIDGEDDPEKVQQFVERYDIESPAVYEPGLGPEYGVSGYPTTYVLDEDNEVIGAHSGEAPREVYEGWIEKALGSGG